MLTTFDDDDNVHGALRADSWSKTWHLEDMLSAVPQRHPPPHRRLRHPPRTPARDLPGGHRPRTRGTGSGRGLSNAEIAAALHMSPGTAKAEIAGLLTKLGAGDRVQLVIAAAWSPHSPPFRGEAPQQPPPAPLRCSRESALLPVSATGPRPPAAFPLGCPSLPLVECYPPARSVRPQPAHDRDPKGDRPIRVVGALRESPVAIDPRPAIQTVTRAGSGCRARSRRRGGHRETGGGSS
ncbi:response regulator transcription factor [Nonomuraea monospora]|uniref:response regulator transcription factor n=1 Tax=Nonomuraea monospora TaxID=568818 RepID=UPI003CD0B376